MEIFILTTGWIVISTSKLGNSRVGNRCWIGGGGQNQQEGKGEQNFSFEIKFEVP